MTSRWMYEHVDTVASASFGIELFYVTDNNRVEQDHLVLRQVDGDDWREVWVGSDAVRPLVSTLEAHRPGQLTLFDQETMA